MENLKTFSKYLRTHYLNDLTKEYLRIIQSLDIPIVKLILEKNLFPGMTEEKGFELAKTGLGKFLNSIEQETLFEEAKRGLQMWEEDKIPGISKNDIRPSDLILIYAAQKIAILKFLPLYTVEVSEAVNITVELENYYMHVQDDAVKLLFKIQKQNEEARQRLVTILEASSDFIGFADAKDRHLIYINPAGRSMVGVGKNDDITTLKIEDVHPAWVNDLLSKELIPAVMKNGIWKGEGAFINIKTKLEIPVSMVLLSHKTPDGNIEFFSTISRDISDIKKTETELKQLSEELMRSNKELEQFAYVASHDLQEPLRTVSSYVQLLETRYKDKLDQDANDYINFAVDGSNRMRQLINSLLEYSRVSRVKPFEMINTNEVVSDVLLDLTDQVNEKGAVLKYDNLPEVYGDEILIGQLFQNLISNALKFTGKVRPEIIISGEKRNGNCLFSVKDNGIGIQKEYWDKIFVIFQRLNSREMYPGTGIGLSVCKKIVERHGGKIWVESEPDKGTTFYFTLENQPANNIPILVENNAREDKHIAHRG
jgi:signal transduction histidine kinase